jgi:hypothetical protein
MRKLHWAALPLLLVFAGCGARSDPAGSSESPGVKAAAVPNPGSTPVRIEDPTGSHCIDASKESVTIHIRRLFLQKTGGLFTEDKQAGVLVTSKLSGQGVGQSIDVAIPSVNQVKISEDSKGHVSVPLEYEIAQYFTLKQPKGTYYGMNLAVSLAKTRGKNTFGEVLDLAGKALGQVKLPANPYTDAASQFLKFATDAIDNSIKNNGTVPFANIALAFNAAAESDLKKCRAQGKERTGAFAVLLSTGDPGNLIPVANTEALYCLSYTSGETYEITAAKRNADGSCPVASAYKAITNDNIFFLMSASPEKAIGKPSVEEQDESRRRCEYYKLPPAACGVSM